MAELPPALVGRPEGGAGEGTVGQEGEESTPLIN